VLVVEGMRVAAFLDSLVSHDLLRMCFVSLSGHLVSVRYHQCRFSHGYNMATGRRVFADVVDAHVPDMWKGRVAAERMEGKGAGSRLAERVFVRRATPCFAKMDAAGAV
jgi:hypothetical protein